MNARSPLRSLHRVLLDAFSPEEFARLLRLNLGLSLDRITGPRSDIAHQVFKVVQMAEDAGWTHDLVRAAFAAKPMREDLGQVLRDLGLGGDIDIQIGGSAAMSCSSASDLDTVPGLEKKFRDWGAYQVELAEIEPRVCRMEVGGTVSGTGFLVGPDTVLTCAHVVQGVLGGSQPSSFLRCRFDYRVLPDGVTTEGILVGLNQSDWLIDSSPLPGGNPNDQPPGLDYALLRLDRPLGEEPRDRTTGGASQRGWLRMPEQDPVFEPRSPLFIAQYILNGPLKITMDMEAVVGLTESDTRVRYTTSAEPKSSGAPCFDRNWELVAMNQSRVPDMEGKPSQIFEGITMAAIRDRIRQHNVELTPGRAAVCTRSASIAPRLEAANPPAPGPIVNADDPQKDRWGGSASRNGREVTAELLQASGPVFTFHVHVSSIDGSSLQGPVIFHLHDTYPHSVIHIRKIKENRVATLYEVESYGVYTIGVQVKDSADQWVGLEYCLTKLPGLPERFLGK